jgi:hypothetical protein
MQSAANYRRGNLNKFNCLVIINTGNNDVPYHIPLGLMPFHSLSLRERKNFSQISRRVEYFIPRYHINNSKEMNTATVWWFEQDLKQVTNNHLDILARE